MEKKLLSSLCCVCDHLLAARSPAISLPFRASRDLAIRFSGGRGPVWGSARVTKRFFREQRRVLRWKNLT